MFNGYGLGGLTRDIKLTPEEVEKLKSSLIEWDGEFYSKIFEWKNSEDLYKLAINQQIEINRLNNIINKAREYIKLVATDHDIMNNDEIIYTQMQYEEIENLLEILDKENDNNGIKK